MSNSLEFGDRVTRSGSCWPFRPQYYGKVLPLSGNIPTRTMTIFACRREVESKCICSNAANMQGNHSSIKTPYPNFLSIVKALFNSEIHRATSYDSASASATVLGALSCRLNHRVSRLLISWKLPYYTASLGVDDANLLPIIHKTHHLNRLSTDIDCMHREQQVIFGPHSEGISHQQGRADDEGACHSPWDTIWWIIVSHVSIRIHKYITG